jgi:hypothetical protein
MCTEKEESKADRKQMKNMVRMIKIMTRRYGEIFKAQQKGMYETMVEIVRRMKRAGLTLDEIAEFTDLSHEAIKKM